MFTSSHLHISFQRLQNPIKWALRCLHSSPQMTSLTRTHAVVFLPPESYDLRMNRILILLAMLVVGNVYALPPCPPDVFHNCSGTQTFANGSQYVGEYKDGKFHGQGTLTVADGSKYVGKFKDGKYHGQGARTFANGASYVGELKDGKMHGQGTLTVAN